jgi:DMSO/TMAO reductase YedYZ molybdopterin-dependent catalytic subunit
LDAGTFADEYVERYVKDILLARSRQPDVLVAYAMNGEALTDEHGFPARAFIPGYFGTNAVKWLSRITLEATRPMGLFTPRLYNRTVGAEGEQAIEPVRELDVQSVIVRPTDGERLSPGAHQITGWAWGAWPISGVDVSFDGATWDVAELRERGNTPTWQRFAFNWVATRGTHEIRCRAADSRGRIQPDEGRNSVHAITVTIG